MTSIVATHRANGQYYNDALSDFDGITLLENKDDRESAYWIYTMRVAIRSGFIEKMKEAGKAVSRVHDRNDKHICVDDYRSGLPGTDEICDDMICIPCGWWVKEADREYIVEKIKEGW